jgi:hypothetical protein
MQVQEATVFMKHSKPKRKSRCKEWRAVIYVKHSRQKITQGVWRQCYM